MVLHQLLLLYYIFMIRIIIAATIIIIISTASATLTTIFLGDHLSYWRTTTLQAQKKKKKKKTWDVRQIVVGTNCEHRTRYQYSTNPCNTTELHFSFVFHFFFREWNYDVPSLCHWKKKKRIYTYTAKLLCLNLFRFNLNLIFFCSSLCVFCSSVRHHSLTHSHKLAP